MMIKKLLLIGIIAAYGAVFYLQERQNQEVKPVLAHPLPSIVQKAVLGYLRQLGGEMHFIKTAVFVGGNFTNYPDETYASGLAANFHAMVDLNPHFIDSYFLCQSNLAFIGGDWTREANAILQKGVEANPTNWTIPFFQSFNYNHFLEDPGKAAETLRFLSKIEGAPKWLEHLSSIRAAQGGDILSGLIWLKAMHKAEENEVIRERFAREIEDFKQALEVQKAIFAYQQQHGRHPDQLEELIPQFIPALPTFIEPFVLVWEPPDLKLRRPDRKKGL